MVLYINLVTATILLSTSALKDGVVSGLRPGPSVAGPLTPLGSKD